jgi:hypothetical protein
MSGGCERELEWQDAHLIHYGFALSGQGVWQRTIGQRWRLDGIATDAGVVLRLVDGDLGATVELPRQAKSARDMAQILCAMTLSVDPRAEAGEE